MGCFVRFGEWHTQQLWVSACWPSEDTSILSIPKPYATSEFGQVWWVRWFFSDFLAPEVPFLVKKNGEKHPIWTFETRSYEFSCCCGFCKGLEQKTMWPFGWFQPWNVFGLPHEFPAATRLIEGRTIGMKCETRYETCDWRDTKTYPVGWFHLLGQ